MLNEVSKWQRNKERLKLQSNYKKKEKKEKKGKDKETRTSTLHKLRTDRSA